MSKDNSIIPSSVVDQPQITETSLLPLMETHDDNAELDESVIKGIQNRDFSPKPPLIVKNSSYKVNPRFRARKETVMVPGSFLRTNEPSDDGSDHGDNSQIKITKNYSTLTGSAGAAVKN